MTAVQSLMNLPVSCMQSAERKSPSMRKAAMDYNKKDLSYNYHNVEFKRTSSPGDGLSIMLHNETLQNLDLKDKVVLEIGCAGGEALIKLQNRGAAALIGVDQNPVFIDIARAEVRTSAVQDGTVPDFFVADMHDLPFDTDSVDVIISRFTLHYTEDARQLAQELRRVLKPGGLLRCVMNVVDMKPSFSTTPYLEEPVASNRWFPIFIDFGMRQFTATNCATSTQEWIDALEESDFDITLSTKLLASEKWNNNRVKYDHCDKADLFTFTVHAQLQH